MIHNSIADLLTVFDNISDCTMSDPDRAWLTREINELINNQPRKNTDRELFREVVNDSYSPSVHVTIDGKIGINVGGTVLVRSLADWHNLGTIKQENTIDKLTPAQIKEFVGLLPLAYESAEEGFRLRVYGPSKEVLDPLVTWINALLEQRPKKMACDKCDGKGQVWIVDRVEQGQDYGPSEIGHHEVCLCCVDRLKELVTEMLKTLKWARSLYRPGNDSDLCKDMNAIIVKAEEMLK